MARFCVIPKSSGCNRGYRVLGIVLMVVGALLFLIFVPHWVWTGALGILFISVGFIIWRFMS